MFLNTYLKWQKNTSIIYDFIVIKILGATIAAIGLLFVVLWLIYVEFDAIYSYSSNYYILKQLSWWGKFAGGDEEWRNNFNEREACTIKKNKRTGVIYEYFINPFNLTWLLHKLEWKIC